MTIEWRNHPHFPLLVCIDTNEPKRWLATMAKNMDGTIYPRIRDPQARVPHITTEQAETYLKKLINRPS